MKILVISSNYPTKAMPNHGAFVYNLMQELGKKHSVTLVSPYKIHWLLKKKHSSYGNEKCKVERPLYFSFSNKNIAGFNTRRLGSYCFKKAVNKVIRRLPVKPDIIYTHFLNNAIPVLDYSKKNKIPLVAASGESTYTGWKKRPESIKRKLKHLVKHIICVSDENKEQLIVLDFDPGKISVIPNAVNYERFKPLDKDQCKKKLNIDPAKFVVGFIGHFIHRKGPNRIIEAIESLHDKDIQLVCVGGKGQLEINNFTKEIPPVANYQLTEIYNAFDIFVLPTLNEGSCNVIEEAKACCIPIVSSTGTSVEEQIDSSMGILVDPSDIKQIAEAIMTLKDDGALREGMTKKLIAKRGENSIEERARKIADILYFLNSEGEYLEKK